MPPYHVPTCSCYLYLIHLLYYTGTCSIFFTLCPLFWLLSSMLCNFKQQHICGQCSLSFYPLYDICLLYCTLARTHSCPPYVYSSQPPILQISPIDHIPNPFFYGGTWILWIKACFFIFDLHKTPLEHIHECPIHARDVPPCPYPYPTTLAPPSHPRATNVGIYGLLGQLSSKSIIGFGDAGLLVGGKNMADIDTGTLLYVCALIHTEAFVAGEYVCPFFHGIPSAGACDRPGPQVEHLVCF